LPGGLRALAGGAEEYFGHHPRVKSNRVYLAFQPITSSPAKAGTESKKTGISKRIEIKSWFKDYCNSAYIFKKITYNKRIFLIGG
jgi:hypothetical protein